MCGRYTLTAKQEELVQRFLLKQIAEELMNELKPRYNIAPSQKMLAVRQSPEHGGRELAAFSWGLIPFWAKDPKIGYKTINARSETVAEKPAYRAAIKSRRCLIPASGFYEWLREEKSRPKQPFYVAMASGDVFSMAGVWESWKSPEGAVIVSCSILTTSANEIMAPVHHRMPVIIDEENYDCWLDLEEKNPEKLKSLFKPYASKQMICYPISTLVNSPRNEGPELLQEIDPKAGQFKEPPRDELFNGHGERDV